MAYPESSDVSAGQPTASAHYNNLRKDAVYLGYTDADAVELGILLEKFEKNLTLELLDTDRIRVPASAGVPVYLMVDGYMMRVTANVDLSTGSKPSGAANQYYVFAVRTGSSTNFTLDVNTTDTEAADNRRIGGFYWDGSVIDPQSIYMEDRDNLLDKLCKLGSQVCNGRLTLVTADPVGDGVSAQGTMYFTEYLGNRIGLYGSGLGWKEYSFSELSVSLTGLTSGRGADFFIFDEEGTLVLEMVEWTSATARATALVLQDGVYVKSGETNKRYVGSCYASGSGVSSNSLSGRYVWNMYNRVPQRVVTQVATASWAYTSAVWRSMNNDTAKRVLMFRGLDIDHVEIWCNGLVLTTGGTWCGVGIGVGVTNVDTSDIQQGTLSNVTVGALARYTGLPGIGYRYFQALEWGGTGCTFYGNAGTPILAGMSGLVWA